MPRTVRLRSNSGIYHIILRGTNRQEIFHSDADCIKFLNILMKYKEISEIKVYGWCLMGNHVHLLLQKGNEEISDTMKRIGVSYAQFYNWKYKTTGHLFQDRYKSECIENDQYLIAVVRYLHQNPVKAGIVNTPTDWKWSSCQGYYGNECYPTFLLDSELILGIFSEDKTEGIKKFIEYNEIRNNEQFLDDCVKIRLTDDEAREKIRKTVSEHEIPTIKSLPKPQRDKTVCKIKRINGLTQRQISRILGIPLSLVNRAK